MTTRFALGLASAMGVPPEIGAVTERLAHVLDCKG